MSGFLFVDHTLKNTYRLKSELPGDEICGDEKTKRIYASPGGVALHGLIHAKKHIIATENHKK
jgi:hypothetical protein